MPSVPLWRTFYRSPVFADDELTHSESKWRGFALQNQRSNGVWKLFAYGAFGVGAYFTYIQHRYPDQTGM